MGTIVDKFNYSFEAKDLIKDSINNLGGSITSETELKEYAEELGNIYTSLPKTTGEDTNLSLTTLKGKMNTTLKGDTQQRNLPSTYQQVEYIESTGSAYIDTGIIPNTNTKIDISFELITKGNYGIIFGGEDAYNSNGFHLYNTSGNFDISFGARYSASTIPFELNTKYKFVMDKTGFTLNSTSGTFETNTISTTYSIYLFAVHRATNVTETNALKRIYYCKLYNNGTLVRDMIPCYRVSDNVIGMYDLVSNTFFTNAGSGAFTKGNNAPTPSTPINIEVVTGTQEVVVGNKNILKPTLQTRTINGVTCTKNADNTFTFNGTATAQTLFPVQTISLDTTKTYTLSGTPSGGSSNTYYIAGANFVDYGSGSTAIPSRENLTISIVFQNGVTCNNLVFKPQLEYGSAKTDYVEHQEQTQTISLGDIELCKIGNYQDYLYKSNDKWYKKENITNIQLTNSMTWNNGGGATGITRYYTEYIKTNVVTPANNDTLAQGYSNIGMVTATQTYNGSKLGVAIHPNGSIYIDSSIKDSLSSKEVWLYYVYSTPQDIEITNTTLISQLDNLEKLKSYNGVTNISSSGNLSAILGVSALKGE